MCFSVHRQPTITFPYRVHHYLVNDLETTLPVDLINAIDDAGITTNYC